MFLAGIRCGSKKPPSAHCLSAIVEELEFLATEGKVLKFVAFSHNHSYTGIRVDFKGHRLLVCRARLLFALADLPAKAALYNVTQYNGQFGCPCFKHEGEQVGALFSQKFIAF